MSISYAVFCLTPHSPRSTLFPYTTLFRSSFALVDPLDGTREFVAGRDEFTINVALVSDGRPWLGIVAAPARGLLWRGIEGGGAERLLLTPRSEEHTSELQSHVNLVCRLLLDTALTALHPLSLHDALPI